jgi:outer membrane lipoprotein carrier protein
MNVMTRFAVVLLSAGLLPALLGAQTERSADAVAQGLQARYQGVQDFSADFVQSYRGGVLKTRSNHKGTVAVKKPGKMRWIYTSPERQEIVSDGRKTYWYVPEDKQVTVSDVGSGDQGLPAIFLSGKGDIARDFTTSFVKAPSADLLALKLVPRREQPEYEYLVVALDPASLQLRELTTRDRQGGESTLTLTNMKENRRLSDKDFVFTPPRGVNVVTDGTR